MSVIMVTSLTLLFLTCAVFMTSDLRAMSERYRFYSVLVLSVLVGSTLLALALSSSLQKRISEPIMTLAAIAKGVSERRDYSSRVERHSDDELGVLTEAFNDMLSQIQLRDRSLRRSEARLKAILESALDCVITLDHE